MRHGRARRRLADLPDGLLSDAEDRAVRAHVAGCARCRGELAALDASAALLRRMPASLLPVEPSRVAEARLALLARWAPDAETARREAGRWDAFHLPALGAAVGAAAVALALLMTPRAEPIDAGPDPFNLVLVGELSPRAKARRPEPRNETVQLVVLTSADSVLLPVGVR